MEGPHFAFKKSLKRWQPELQFVFQRLARLRPSLRMSVKVVLTNHSYLIQLSEKYYQSGFTTRNQKYVLDSTKKDFGTEVVYSAVCR